MPKNKKRACGLCKPHKRGLAPRDTERQRMEMRLARMEIEIGFEPVRRLRIGEVERAGIIERS